MKHFLTNKQQSALVDLEGEYESVLDEVNGRFTQPVVGLTEHDVNVATWSIKRPLAVLRALLEDRGAWETTVRRDMEHAFQRVLAALVETASTSDLPAEGLDDNIEVAPMTYCGAMWTFEEGAADTVGGAYLCMVFQAGFRIGHLVPERMAS